MNSCMKKFMLYVQDLFNDFDSLVKEPLTASNIGDKPPIFIVGAPRTGSTMVFQMMLSQFQLSYISNAMALFPSVMVKMCKLSKRVACGYAGNLRESEYGFVPGLFSPNEAGQIVRKWFDHMENEREQEYIRRTFYLISSMTGYPVAMKNPTNSIRIQKIRSVLPNSRFIFLQRDALMTAQSILLGRRVSGGDEHWWSVQPPGYESVLDKSPLYQVLWQVLTIERLVLSSFADTPDVLFKMTYEEFCRNPRLALQKLHETFQLEWRKDAAPFNEAIPTSNKVRLTLEEWCKLEDIYREMKASGQNDVEYSDFPASQALSNQEDCTLNK